MILRGVNLLNHISNHARRKNILLNKQSARFSHEFAYRDTIDPPSRGWIISSELLGGMVWWWVLYRMWYDYEHITGHWKPPDPSKWTDEELGIPANTSD